MKHVRSGILVGTVLAGLVVIPATGIAGTAATSCVPELLPNVQGDIPVEVTGSNGAGVYVGIAKSWESGETYGVVWRDGAAERLDELIPLDINSDGLMAGYVKLPDQFGGTYSKAALQPLDGDVEQLPPGGVYHSSARGVNDRGDAVGPVLLEHPVVDWPALWPADDHSESVVLDGGYTGAREIDDAGFILGADWGNSNGHGGVIWRANGTVLREYAPETRTELFDLDNGQAVATRTPPDPNQGQEIVAIDAESGTETVVPNSTWGTPTDINNGVIVGDGPGGPAMWHDGQMIVLPSADNTEAHEVTVVNEDGTELAGMSHWGGDDPVATIWRCTAAG